MIVARYHPVLVALHWFLGAFLLLDLYLGTFLLKTIPNTSPDKLEALWAHMTGGLFILVLMSLRFVVRSTSTKPSPATAGNALLDRVAKISHIGLYVLVFLMVATGIATAVIGNLFTIVFAHSGANFPATFDDIPSRILHGYIAKALFALIALHIIAALYHQFVRRDGLFDRMWFGRRFPAPRRDAGSAPRALASPPVDRPIQETVR